MRLRKFVRLVVLSAAISAMLFPALVRADVAQTPVPKAKPAVHNVRVASAPSATPTPAAAPLRRALPAPASDIFPASDFLGPTIGVPTDRGNLVYGWFNPAVMFATSKNSSFPMTYNNAPNMINLDQLILRFERQPDTVQTDHFDWGYRVSNLFGMDYRWTTSQGYFSNQLLGKNYLYGYDPVELYGMLYFPRFGQGTVLQVGRYISPPDIEAQLAPNNFLYSHSIFFDFDAYTQTGFLFSTKLSNYWSLVYGIHSGNDTAPWNPSQHFPTFELLGRWISHANKDSIYAGVDAINFTPYMRTYTFGGQLYGHDNLQQYNATWTHVFNPKFQNLLEGYYLTSFNAYVGGTINNGVFKFGTGGGPGAFLPGRSVATGFVDYITYQTSTKDFVVFRPDYMNDQSGWRSGFPTAYGSLTLGLTHKATNWFWLRPEVRVEKAFRAGITPYDNGTKAYQSSIAVDALFFFGHS